MGGAVPYRRLAVRVFDPKMGNVVTFDVDVAPDAYLEYVIFMYRDVTQYVAKDSRLATQLGS